MPDWAITLLIFLAVLVIAGAIYLMDDGNANAFDRRVSRALQWWSQTDERLAETSTQTLRLLISEVDDLLKRPEYLFEETAQRLADLRHRLKRAKDGL